VSSQQRFPTVGLALLAVAVSLALGQDAPTPTPTPAPATAPATAPAADAAPAPATPPAESGPEAAALQEAKDAFKKGSWQDARDAALRVLATQPKDLDALYIAGASERQTGKLADSEGHLRTLLEVSPIFPLAHFQLGYALFLRAEAFTREGQVESAKAKYIDAAGEFGKELARAPTHAASLSSRAIALSRAGQLDESVQAHEAWMAAAPQKNEPVVSLAATYAGAGRASDAMSTLERLPDKTPKTIFDGAVAAATVFSARKDWSAAVPFLEKAVSTDPTSTRARALLTESCARAGLANDTARNLQALLTMSPGGDDAELAGEAIKSSLGDGRHAPTIPGVQRPAVLRVPAPRYPKGQDDSVQTEVLVLTLVKADGSVGDTVMVPNRIWKDIRSTGFEAAAFDAVRRGKFSPGTKDGQPADLWIVISVNFSRM
jgi:tetratricopeptide (TPR) repeat protein